MGLRIARATALAAVALATAGSTAASAQTVAATPDPQAGQVAQAQPQPPPAGFKILDEIKLGMLAHDVGIGGHHKENGYDVNGEILFASPQIFKVIWSPRPHLGIDGNTNGKTSFYYGGLTWGGVFYRPGWLPDDGFFADLALGGSVNDGKISTTDRHRKSLGSHELFREGLDIGYRLNALVSVSGFIDHSSNAGLANRNEGITNAGARIGFKF